MIRTHARLAIPLALLGCLPAMPAAALLPAVYSFSTGDPDGLMATASRPDSAGKFEIESADDFVLTTTTSVTSATFTGLLTGDGSVSNVRVEIYRVFPNDSDVGRTSGPPMFATAQVPARLNSPSDVEIDDATRDGASGTLEFTPSLVNPSFRVANTVVTGINKKPNQTTHGDGAATGEEVEITITFTPPILLPADHYFFRPEVQVTGGDFLYLSAPKPIVAPGTPFLGDLQAWIRNSDLKPDWLRIGTDIIGGTPVQTFNMALSLAGETVPQATPTATPTVPPSNDGGDGCGIGAAPSANRRTLWLLLAPVAVLRWRRRRRG